MEKRKCVIKGIFPNPCGHALLFVPHVRAIASDNGYYFQVAQAYGLPLIMDTDGYAHYLRENKKKEITRCAVHLKKPEEAYAKLEALMMKEWVWGVLPNNCAAFVFESL